MRRAVFLDRDGTINREVGYVSDPDVLELLPGVAEAIKRLNQSGWLVIAVTNQSGIGRGYLSHEMVEGVHQRLEAMLAGEGAFLDSIRYCPHHPDAGCDCRKPAVGLICQAAADSHIDLSNSYVVGDKESDIELGHRAGTRTILVLTGYGKETQRRIDQVDFVASDLESAVHWILTKEHSGEG